MGSEIQTTETKKKGKTRLFNIVDRKQNFIDHFMRELNKCRLNPAAYADIVERHLQYIKPNEDPNSKNAAFYVREGMPKISLSKGESAFKEFAQKLREMIPMNKLEFRSNLQIPIPETPTEWTSKEYIATSVNNCKNELKSTSNYKSFNFHFDVGSPLSENSFVLQLVDDTPFKGSRSRNILNPKFSYVGISSHKLKNKHCGYFLFAN
jgi:hypothetical protein